MEIMEMTLLDFVGQPGAHFEIPRFQRAYSWEAEQCDELWRDVFRAQRAGRTHFVGSFIYHEAAPGTFHIVDGQQRVTTLSLILAALASVMREKDESFFGVDADHIERHYLIEGGASKLTLSQSDQAAYDAAVCGRELPERCSGRVAANLVRFGEKMHAEGFDALQLWQGLSALTVIAVRLDSDEQAPAVFESFNSKGVPLVTADLVRNYLLLAESRREQARLYDTYWNPIQGVFGDDPGSLKLNNAILGWLAVRLSAVRKFGDAQAFSIFKSFCEDEYDGTADDLLEELYAFCMVWAENYRYHSVKKYKSADWAKLGRKTRVSGRPLAPLDNPESGEYYKRHFGVDPKW